MIDVFGTYHLVFWNCQIFAKILVKALCNEPDADFGFLTSTEAAGVVIDLCFIHLLIQKFLCAFAVASPIMWTSTIAEKNRKIPLIQAAKAQQLIHRFKQDLVDTTSLDRITQATLEALFIETYLENQPKKKNQRRTKGNNDCINFCIIDPNFQVY